MTANQLAVCSWSLQPGDPEHLVELVRQTGVDAIQLALSPLVHDREGWSGAIETLRRSGIGVVSGMMQTADEDYTTLESIARTGGVRPDGTWDRNRAHAAAVADLAAYAEIGLVTFHAGFIPERADDPERRKLLDRLRFLGDLFAARGLRLGLETGQETAETLDEVLGELDHDAVGVNFDPANMILYGKGDPVSALRRLARRVVQVHIKDALPADTPGTWGREVPAGQGAVDWPAFFDVARALDPPVDFVIEREAGGERIDDIVAACELACQHLGRQ